MRTLDVQQRCTDLAQSSEFSKPTAAYDREVSWCIVILGCTVERIKWLSRVSKNNYTLRKDKLCSCQVAF